MQSKEGEREKIPTSFKIRALLCAMGVNFMTGTFYAYTNMYVYVSNYLRIYDPTLDADGKDALLVMPLWIVSLSLAAVASIKLADRVGYWALNYAAFSWFCLNHAIVIFVKNYHTFLLVYGVGNGLACGLGYLPTLYIAWTYFPEQKSLATGLILLATAISIFILSPLITFLVNPDDLTSDQEDVQKKVPFMFACLTVLFLSITLTACSLQPSPWQNYSQSSEQNQPKDHKTQKLCHMLERAKVLGVEIDGYKFGTQRLGEETAGQEGQGLLIVGQLGANSINDITMNYAQDRSEKEIAQESGRSSQLISPKEIDKEIKRIAREIREKSCPNLKTALTSPQFFSLSFMVICSAIYFYLMLTSWKHNFKKMISLKDRELSFLLSVGSIGNALGKAFCGVALLKLNFKILYLASNTLIIIYGLSFNYMMAEHGTILTAGAYLGLAFFGLGMNMTMFPTICMKTFGGEVGSKAYPLIYMCFAISNFASYLFYKYVDNVQAVFITMSFFAACGIVICYFFNASPTWYKPTDLKSSVVTVELSDK